MTKSRMSQRQLMGVSVLSVPTVTEHSFYNFLKTTSFLNALQKADASRTGRRRPW